MNAIEHGNRGRAELRVGIQVQVSEKAIVVQVSDRGNGPPAADPEPPDLAAKIAGRQSPRGWGLFLIDNMVDQANVVRAETGHTLELVMFRGEGEPDVSQA
jgi:anti-sigma regulatory factor (Ser/Thr protein kinase)